MTFFFKESVSVFTYKISAATYAIEQTEDAAEDEKKEATDADDELILTTFEVSLINTSEKASILFKNWYSKTDFIQEITPPPPKPLA